MGWDHWERLESANNHDNMFLTAAWFYCCWLSAEVTSTYISSPAWLNCCSSTTCSSSVAWFYLLLAFSWSDVNLHLFTGVTLPLLVSSRGHNSNNMFLNSSMTLLLLAFSWSRVSNSNHDNMLLNGGVILLLLSFSWSLVSLRHLFNDVTLLVFQLESRHNGSHDNMFLNGGVTLLLLSFSWSRVSNSNHDNMFLNGGVTLLLLSFSWSLVSLQYIPSATATTCSSTAAWLYCCWPSAGVVSGTATTTTCSSMAAWPYCCCLSAGVSSAYYTSLLRRDSTAVGFHLESRQQYNNMFLNRGVTRSLSTLSRNHASFYNTNSRS